MKIGVKLKKIFISKFNGINLTDSSGIILLQKIENKLNLIKEVASVIKDGRVSYKCKHDVLSMIKQRVFSIALGNEDLNDQIYNRHDLLLQNAIGYNRPLASCTTLSNFERRIDRKEIIFIHKILVKNFVKSYLKIPKKIILDFDGTESKVYGKQEGSMYNGYYKHKCYLPLYVFCEGHLLVAYLRPGNVQDSKHSWAILKLLVKEIRKFWPDVKIVFRGDSAFCRHEMFNWCEKNNVYYITGISVNNRLLKLAYPNIHKAKKLFNKRVKFQKIFTEFKYAAATWRRERRIILKTEYDINKFRNCFIVTNLPNEPQYLYEKIYSARGEMENRIKEQQLYLFSNRTSSKDMLSNQFRLLLSGIAYTLLDSLRRLCLKTTKYAKSTCLTIRLKLLKIVAIIIDNGKTIKILFSNSYPWKYLFNISLIRLDMK